MCATDYKNITKPHAFWFLLALNIPQLNKTIQSKTNFGFVDESAMRVLAGVVN